MDYKMVLTNTDMNCNGGRTPWNAWISCEEDFDRADGKAWQVDPLGLREPQVITLGSEGGIFEAFGFDVRDDANPHFFLTEDDYHGALQRFTPHSTNQTDPWTILLGSGTIEYLVLIPSQENNNVGAYTWVSNKEQAQENAGLYYPNSEGMEVMGQYLFFVCKKHKHIFELDLDSMTYRRRSTRNGLFDGEPDQVKKFTTEDGPMLFFTEDGGEKAGIHAMNSSGIFTLLEGSNYGPETTGICFSPDGTRMYFAFQEDGFLFEVQRIDGQSFRASTVRVKQHQYESSTQVSRQRRRRERDRKRKRKRLLLEA